MSGSVRCVLSNSSLWYPVSLSSASILSSQSVRWRKPRWLPVAPSKMFKIPVKPKRDPLETRELKRLFDNYNSHMKSLTQHLIDENLRTANTSELALQQIEKEEEEHRQLMEYNRQENLRVAALREERVEKKHEMDLARVEASLVKHAIQKAAVKEEAERVIEEIQELVKTFIKREDLEKAITEAMANPTDYNFALDQDGHIFRGRNTKPQDIDKDKWEKLEGSVLF